ncbi:hypothetical protein RZ64_07285 [[Haemophilus] ducreyi]|uniref:hypothetical protein n=1 Tax=Haemophilus ducreyi TaxID=730 RepID=UPI000655F82B|nr:hypothetical protein RZ64_07285 [[Haemophilus] ducreyi]
MKYALTNGVIYTAKDVLYGYAVVVENGIIQAVVRQTELASGLAKSVINQLAKTSIRLGEKNEICVNEWRYLYG